MDITAGQSDSGGDGEDAGGVGLDGGQVRCGAHDSGGPCRDRCVEPFQEQAGWGVLKVAGRELTGITVVDLDASVVTASSDKKENAKPTYKGGVGFVPNLATCDNVDDILVIDPRPGNATSNDAADNIAALDTAIASIPGKYRRKVLVRLDGAGFSHKLLEHIASGGGIKGRTWEFSVGWACTDREINAIDATPEAVWHNGIDQDGNLLDDTRVADISPTAARREVPPPACST